MFENLFELLIGKAIVEILDILGAKMKEFEESNCRYPTEKEIGRMVNDIRPSLLGELR